MVDKITPFLMFEGQAEVALDFYVGLIPGAEVKRLERYGRGEPGAEGKVRIAFFSLAGQEFICIDSPVHHEFGFTPSISLFVDCADEAEIERLFAALAEGGVVRMPLDNYGFSLRFGWVDDRFGVSWQVNLPAS
ncbi:MAG TPA: VOC family protein [Phenylobacterium sp.]|jgi:predicted 3-demethylubiquinone-9 3-methyltransferase (glyoxalase superfamily)|uniref:VOC family protein n=1 Tax=Phenylobacterium sp. TaxID=1871053 RepID=UPI002C60E5AF|nr:VOC family protein [Phenylobacterium sp.]HXA37441.1 VOC family protein [Phenylobacterium sp.]